ncbi:inorganic phosphate transporter [Paenibacillus flagellatus]|uniref:Phosphate transporter n=1 Tax=Paenibacillus flagellatus TaxID=2211139 RepID=A0A2V5KCY7_9BACL|nr:inorganic phosphate transporter [Paenibacillus flagellatus]PYI51740.1 anion permease [Paenibacillus flagellatus]
MVLGIIAFATAFFFAANIGASGTAAAMGAAYGGGALRSRTAAVWLVAAFAVAGAMLGGGEVVTTISKGIIPESMISIEASVVILLSAAITLFSANRIGIPLSTSEVAVGSIVGVGIAFRNVYWGNVAFMVAVWIVLPFAAFAIAYALGRASRPVERLLARLLPGAAPKLLSACLIAMGCYEAFSAGMNNVANAIGPIVGAGLIGTGAGIALGSLFMAAGAIAMGGRVLETNGKKITKLTLMQGSVVSFTSGTLVIIASMFGLPVPLTQATTMAIMGVGTESIGTSLFRQPIVKRIFRVWLYSPLIAMIVSLLLMETVLHGSFWLAFAIVASLAFTLALLLRKTKLPAETAECYARQAEKPLP